MNELSLQEQVKIKNRKKLLQQNTRLLSQIRHLQAEIDEFQQLPLAKIQQEQTFSVIKNELQNQKKEIKRLKELIQAARHENIKENVIYIRKEEDQLLCLKQELEAMQKEKQLITNGHIDKLKKLAQNQPLQKHKEQLQSLWANTKKENRQINLKIVQLERQVRKYHNFKEISKGGKTESLTNPTLQFNTMEEQIERMNGQIKMKELKWKTNIDCLDREFFTNKNTLSLICKKAEELQKEEGIWRLRAANLRDQPQILTDRARLSKIISISKSQAPNSLITPQRVSLPFSIPSSKPIINQLKQGNSLNRVSSSPNPSGLDKKQIVKRSRVQQILNKRYNQQLQSNKQKRASSERRKEIVVSKSVKISEQLVTQELKSVKKKKVNVEKSNKSVFLQPERVVKVNEQKKTEQIKKSGWVGRRQKHRIKSSAASDLAEQIKKRAEQVKLINKNLQIEQNESASKIKRNGLSKQEIKQKKVQPIEYVSSQSSKKQNQKIKQGQSPRLVKQKSKSSLETQQVGGMKEIKSNSNSKKIMKSQEENKQKQKKGKQLVQNIELRIQPPKIPIRQQSPKVKTKKQQGVINKLDIETINLESPTSKQSNNPLKHQDVPKQKKEISQIKFQIKISDKITPKHVTDPAEDQTEGVPKIVYRKKLVEGSQVTTGTST